jgi:hypothetical protein
MLGGETDREVDGDDAALLKRLLELQAAVRARAGGQGRRGPARRASQVLGLARRGDGDRSEAFAREVGPPVGTEQLGQLGELILLDQEVRLGPSTLAGAGRTSDERGDAGGQAAISQVLHLRDRAGHRRDERQAVEHFFCQAGR